MRKNFNLILFLITAVCQSQTTKIDSLKTYIKTSKNSWEVTNKCMLLSELLIPSDTIAAKKYLSKGLLIAKKTNDNINIGQYYLLKAMMVTNKSEFEKAIVFSDSSIYFYKKGINLQKKEKEKEKNILNLSSAYCQKAAALNSLGKSEEAIKIYIKTIKEWEKTNLPEKYQGMAVITSSIGGVYLNIGNIKKVLEYDKMGLNYIKKAKSPNKTSLEKDIATLYLFISDDYLKLNKNDLANTYLDSSKTLVEKLNNNSLWQKYLGRKALLLSKAGYNQTALIYYKKSLLYAEKSGEKASIANVKKNIGDKLIKLNRLSEARVFLDEAFKLSETINKFGNRQAYYLSYINLESTSGNYKKALEYSTLLQKLKDSINIIEMSAKINDIDIKYQTEKKTLHIKSLTQENELQDLKIKRRLWTTLSLIIALLGLGTFAYTQYKNFKNKNALLLAQQNNAVAEERLRIASDMHDDVGSGLSRIRYIVGSIANGQTEQKQGLNKVIEISDDAVQKMNEIIWSLNETNQNLEDLIYYIRGQMSEMVENANVNFNCHLPESIPSVFFGWKRNRNTYLLVKEAVNNALKHANAKTITLDFVISNKLQITIIDDGIGFNTAKNFTGNGLNNYKKRIADLNATYQLKSEIDKGTMFTFHLPFEV